MNHEQAKLITRLRPGALVRISYRDMTELVNELGARLTVDVDGFLERVAISVERRVAGLPAQHFRSHFIGSPRMAAGDFELAESALADARLELLHAAQFIDDRERCLAGIHAARERLVDEDNSRAGQGS